MSDRYFCSICGTERTFLPNKQVKVGEIDLGNGRYHSIYGTDCCGAKTFASFRIPYDYGGARHLKPQAERFIHTDIGKLVKLICSIGKNPTSIRKYSNSGYPDIYYFDVVRQDHKGSLHLLLNSSLEISSTK